MSNKEQGSTSSQQQQQQRYPKPPFADWPTIKILTPPKGPFLPKTDEWCFTYCSQTVSGRINGREPNCRSVCIRKVFPHEVRNILQFKQHRTVDAQGKAHYPLPAEGQADNLPRILGGQPKANSDETSNAPSLPTKNWDEGWYFWTGQGRWNFIEKTEKMMVDLPGQEKLDRFRERRRELWHDYEETLKQGGKEGIPPLHSAWWGPIVPPQSKSDTSSSSLLFQLPPNLISAVWDTGRIKKLFAPSLQALEITYDSVTSGEQQEFAKRVWEKAQTEEPWILAKRALLSAYDKWKKSDVAEEDDGKKGPT